MHNTQEITTHTRDADDWSRNLKQSIKCADDLASEATALAELVTIRRDYGVTAAGVDTVQLAEIQTSIKARLERIQQLCWFINPAQKPCGSCGRQIPKDSADTCLQCAFCEE